MEQYFTFFKKQIFRFVLFLFTYVFCSNLLIFSQTKLPNFYDNTPNEELAKLILDAMTDEELLAQTFMFGWVGQEPGDLLINWIANYGLGNIKVFGWNTGDSKKLAKSIYNLQKKSLEGRFSIPLFIATDQEGGCVRHVKGLTSETPGNLAIGASGIPQDAYYSGYYISQELRVLGINLNFAPSVDLLTDLNSSIIGTRSFGDSPNTVSELGIAFMSGSKDAGVLTTAKHFPGHGDTSVDSHGKLPQIKISENTLRTRELIPFKKMIEAGVPVVMTGHLNFPSVSPNGEPATFSKYLLNDILRKELNFDGLIVTDDIMMHGAIGFAGGVSRAVRMAIEAGNDIVESSTTPRPYQPFWKDNLKYLKTNKEFKELVKNATYKILLAKLRYFKSENHVPILPDVESVEKSLPNKDGEKFFLSLAARSATVLRNENIPLKSEKNSRILLASNYNDFFKYGLKRFPNAKTTPISGTLFHMHKFDTLIYCLADNAAADMLKRTMAKYPQKKYIVISVLSPAPLQKFSELKNIISVYSYSPASFKIAFAVLAGDFVATGNMPISGIK